MLSRRCVQVLRAGRRFQSSTAGSATPAYPEHYTVPNIETLSKFQNTGIPGLLSAEGLETAYFSRVKHIIDSLNKELTLKSQDGRAALEVLAKESATNVKHVKIFQNASLIQNIKFAMSSIGEVREENSNQGVFKPDEKAFLKTPDLSLEISNKPSENLTRFLNENFGSLLEFKTLLLNSANSITGDGFVWLVARNNAYFKEDAGVRTGSSSTFDNLFVFNTYNAGSPHNNDRVGQLDILKDKNFPPNVTNANEKTSDSSIASFEDAEFSKYNNVEFIPLLAVDVSPKVWLHDYGVFGKRQYLEQTWKAIDWDIVETRIPLDKEHVIGSDL